MYETWLGREQKDKCKVNMQGKEMAYWTGTEVGMLGGYELKGAKTAGDGSDSKGIMGMVSLRMGNEESANSVRVGREEEGTT